MPLMATPRHELVSMPSNGSIDIIKEDNHFEGMIAVGQSEMNEMEMLRNNEMQVPAEDDQIRMIETFREEARGEEGQEEGLEDGEIVEGETIELATDFFTNE